MAGTVPDLDTDGGHYIYDNGGKYHWVDPVWTITISRAVPMSFVERKGTVNFEVPSEYRKEISTSNAITWEIEKENLAYFRSCNDFTATAVGVSGGQTAVYCKQGGEIIAEWSLTVNEEPQLMRAGEMVVGKRYIITQTSITETTDESFSSSLPLGDTSFVFSSSNLIDVKDSTGGESLAYIVDALAPGYLDVKLNSSSAGTGTTLDTNGGHYIYDNGGSYDWTDFLWSVRIIDGLPEVSVERKSTITLEVPSGDRKEVSTTNYLTWEIGNEKIAYFRTVDDFTATVMGASSGSTIVTCKQRGRAIAQWDLTVTDSSSPARTGVMEVGKRYIISNNSISETTDEHFSMHFELLYTRFDFTPSELIEIKDSTGGNLSYIVDALSTGTLNVNQISSMAGTQPVLDTDGGHYKYNNGGKYHWVDPVWTIEIVESILLKGDVNFDGNINIIDVKLLLQTVISNTYFLSEDQFYVMDINDDDNINIIDVKLLLQQVIAASH